jgi:hypothetical protein
MCATCKHLLAVTVLLAGGASAARAQVHGYVGPTSDYSMFNPYYHGYCYNPYAYAPLANPYGSYLTGVADLTRANGQYEVMHQQTKSIRQQVIGQVIDNRRKLFDEMKYERENTPTIEDLREEEQRTMLRRARNDPPSAEVWSVSYFRESWPLEKLK